MENARLIENSARNYLFQTLQKCHTNRVSIYYYALNFGVLFIFVGIVALVLYYCSKQKLSDYDKQQKMIKDQQYILSKIRYYQEDKKEQQRSQVSGITDLPYIG
jgi:membrane protein insertase Oxa1/YidC/SpoIIIJ